jgi:aspartate-semialdehyde dehydrogenase
MAGLNVAIVGAGDLIGQELLRILQSRRFPVSNLKVIETAANLSISNGRKYSFNGKDLETVEITQRAFRNVDVAFFCGDHDTTQHFAPKLNENGLLIIDASGAFRADERALEIIPEINAAELQNLKKKRIITSPSPATIQLLLPLNTFRTWTRLNRVFVHSYEPVSESGQSAVEQLSSETRQVLEGKAVVPHAYPHQIAFNVLPETENFMDTGLTRAEARIIKEVRRIWRLPDLNISVTSVRVPVFIGMSQSVQVDLGRRVSTDEMREVLGDTPGVKVSDDPSVNLYPHAWQIVNQDEVAVGRLREVDPAHNTIAFWSAMDNLRKGSALNAVQIAETAIELKLV